MAAAPEVSLNFGDLAVYEGHFQVLVYVDLFIARRVHCVGLPEGCDNVILGLPNLGRRRWRSWWRWRRRRRLSRRRNRRAFGSVHRLIERERQQRLRSHLHALSLGARFHGRSACRTGSRANGRSLAPARDGADHRARRGGAARHLGRLRAARRASLGNILRVDPDYFAVHRYGPETERQLSLPRKLAGLLRLNQFHLRVRSALNYGLAIEHDGLI